MLNSDLIHALGEKRMLDLKATIPKNFNRSSSWSKYYIMTLK